MTEYNKQGLIFPATPEINKDEKSRWIFNGFLLRRLFVFVRFQKTRPNEQFASFKHNSTVGRVAFLQFYWTLFVW